MVIVLAGIIEEPGIGPIGSFDDFLDGLSVHTGFGGKITAHSDISLVVFVVMKFECFRRHIWLQGIISVWKFWKFKCHDVFPPINRLNYK